MHKKLRTVAFFSFFCLCFFSFPSLAFGKTIYVSTTGNDVNDGLAPDSAVASLVRAEAVAAAGDTVYIEDGTYQGAALLSQKELNWEGESKDGVIIRSTDGARIIYIAQPATRTFSNLTLQANDPDGANYLIDMGANGVSSTVTFDNVKFENGEVGGLSIRSGTQNWTIQNSEVILSRAGIDYFIVSSAGYTVSNTIFTIDTLINSVFNQSAESNGEQVILSNNTIIMNVASDVVKFRQGGYENPQFIGNQITASTTAYAGRFLLDLRGQINEVIRGNTLDIRATSTDSIPLQLRSLDGTASNAVIENNIIRTRNPEDYGMIIGDEDGGNDVGDGESVENAYDGSRIENNTIYGPGFFGVPTGTIHGIMVGHNVNIDVTSNTVYGMGICMGAKDEGDVWDSGGFTFNNCTNNRFGIRLKGVSNVVVSDNTIISNDGSNSEAVSITENGVGEFSVGVSSTRNTYILDAGRVYEFEDESDTDFESDYNYFDLGGTAIVGNVFVDGQIDRNTLTDWQTATGHDTNSFTFDADTPPTIAFEEISASGEEEVTPVTILIKSSGKFNEIMRVDYAQTGGTATNGDDYTFVNGTASISIGETTTSISIIITDDEVEEDAETIILTLSDPEVASLGASSTFTYTIRLSDSTDPIEDVPNQSRGGSSAFLLIRDNLSKTLQSSSTNDIEQQTENQKEKTQEYKCPLIIGKAYKDPGSTAVYYVTKPYHSDGSVQSGGNCTKRAFRKPEVFFSYFTSWDEYIEDARILTVSDDVLGFMPLGPKHTLQSGSIVKTVSSPKVYLLLEDKKHWITTAEIFDALGYNRSWIKDVSPEFLNRYTAGQDIEEVDQYPEFSLVKYENSSKVYRIERENGNLVRRHIIDSSVFSRLGYRFDRVVIMNEKIDYPEGEPIQ